MYIYIHIYIQGKSTEAFLYDGKLAGLYHLSAFRVTGPELYSLFVIIKLLHYFIFKLVVCVSFHKLMTSNCAVNTRQGKKFEECPGASVCA